MIVKVNESYPGEFDAPAAELEAKIGRALEATLGELVKADTYQSHTFEPKVGDPVRNVNPKCKHFRSEGVVTAVKSLDNGAGSTVKYRATNNGPTWSRGDDLEKTLDQLAPRVSKALRKAGPYIGPRGGQWADAKHTIPYKEDKAGQSSIVSGFKAKVGADDFSMYYDVASGTSPEKWHGYVGKHGYGPAQAEKLRTAIVQHEQGQHRKHAKASFARHEALSFGGVDFASGVVPTIQPKEASIRVSGEVTKAGKLFGGLEAAYPAVRKLVAAGLIRSIVLYKGGGKKSGHEANYNPLTREIEVNNPNVSAGTLLHEIGHALEEAAPEGWMHGAGWGAEQPSGSQYAAAGDPSEQFAEAFVHMIAGDAMGFYEHAPEQAKAIVGAQKALTADGIAKALRKAGPFIGPRGGKWADAKHTIPFGYSGELGGKDHVRALQDHLGAHHGVKVRLTHSRGVTTVHTVVVPKERRGRGVGDAVMDAVKRNADAHGHRITLTAENPENASRGKAQLKKWYKRHGFVENKGRNKDYEVSEGMYRDPKLSKAGPPYIGEAHPHSGGEIDVLEDLTQHVADLYRARLDDLRADLAGVLREG